MSNIKFSNNKIAKINSFKIYRSQYKFSFIGHLYFGFYILLTFLYYFLNLSDYPYQTVSYTTDIDLAIIYVKYSLFILFTLLFFVNIVLMPILAYLFIKEDRSNNRDTKIHNYHIKIGIILTIFLLIIPMLDFIYLNLIHLNNIDNYINQMIGAQLFFFILQNSIPIIMTAVIIYILMKQYSEIDTVQYLGIIGITFVNSFIFYYIFPIITLFFSQFIGTIIPQTKTLGSMTTTISPTSLTQELGVMTTVLIYFIYDLALYLIVDGCFSLLAYKIYSFNLKQTKGQIKILLFGYTVAAIVIYIILSIISPELGFIQELWQPISLEGLLLSLVDILPNLQLGFYSMGFVISLGIVFFHDNKSKISPEPLI